MRFGIQPFGAAPDEHIELTEAEYSSIAAAKVGLGIMMGIEQKFDLVLENYAEYERELLNLALRLVVSSPPNWQGSQSDIALVTRRLSNLLSAVRLYVDQAKHDLNTGFGRSSGIGDMIEEALSSEYDSRLGYRVMETLRNVLQHRDLPIRQLGYSQDSQPGGLRYRTDPRMEVARLLETGAKRSVVAELESKGEYVSLTPLVRDYLEGLAGVHEVVRSATAADSAAWDSTIADAQAKGAEKWGGGEDRAFLVVELDDSGGRPSIQVFKDLTEYRRVLERKNSGLDGLARRYVSGEVETDA